MVCGAAWEEEASAGAGGAAASLCQESEEGEEVGGSEGEFGGALVGSVAEYQASAGGAWGGPAGVAAEPRPVVLGFAPRGARAARRRGGRGSVTWRAVEGGRRRRRLPQRGLTAATGPVNEVDHRDRDTRGDALSQDEGLGGHLLLPFRCLCV